MPKVKYFRVHILPLFTPFQLLTDTYFNATRAGTLLLKLVGQFTVKHFSDFQASVRLNYLSLFLLDFLPSVFACNSTLYPLDWILSESQEDEPSNSVNCRFLCTTAKITLCVMNVHRANNLTIDKKDCLEKFANSLELVTITRFRSLDYICILWAYIR